MNYLKYGENGQFDLTREIKWKTMLKIWRTEKFEKEVRWKLLKC
jgi:hypothetical protein